MKNVTSASDEDKRNYFRIDDIAILSYRTVTREEVRSAERQDPHSPINKFKYKTNFDRLSRELKPLYNVIKSSNSNIAQYLALLDKKIDLLSSLLIHDIAAENEDHVEPQHINIGAGGLSFISDKPFIIDTMLEIQMKLLPENIVIFSYARIISCDLLKQNQEESEYRIAVEFELMDEDVRDLVIRHVLGKERAYVNKE